MNIESYREYCLQLPQVTEALPFDEEVLVFKVAGKIFSLTNLTDFREISLKCDPQLVQERIDLYEGVRAGYHLNKKHWISVTTQADVPEQLILQWTRDSYLLVIKGLPKKIQAQLMGLNQEEDTARKS